MRSGESGIRAFIFDMDGVIVDSNPLHRVAWEEYNRRQGITTTEAMHQRMYGKRNDQIVRDFFGDGLSGRELTPAEIFAHGAAKEELYREMLKPDLEKTLVPGVRDFLARHGGIPTALATNAEPPNVDFILDEAGLRHYFRATVDGHQVEHPKPHPEVYLRAADLLGMEPQYCVVFEDSGTGVQAAKAAGMRVVGLATTHEDLPGVALMIRDFTDPALEQWLNGQ
ncbi:MAG: beta-phosphoglucomutase family hydrolase [Terriglobia bacterium]